MTRAGLTTRRRALVGHPEISPAVRYVAEVPTTGIRNKLREQKAWNSLNQLISLCDEERRHFETKRFGGLEIDHELELRRLFDG